MAVIGKPGWLTGLKDARSAHEYNHFGFEYCTLEVYLLHKYRRENPYYVLF
jgi:hypothetical protein